MQEWVDQYPDSHTMDVKYGIDGKNPYLFHRALLEEWNEDSSFVWSSIPKFYEAYNMQAVFDFCVADETSHDHVYATYKAIYPEHDSLMEEKQLSPRWMPPYCLCLMSLVLVTSKGPTILVQHTEEQAKAFARSHP
jgi:hypothetical protein